MAYIYNQYTVKGERTIYYRFTCGKCGKTADWKANTIHAEYVASVNAKRKQPSSEDLQKMLKSGLEKKLDKHVDTIKKGAKRGYYFISPYRTEDEYAYNLDSACPFCGQRHKNKGSSGKAAIYGGLVGLFAGLIASLIVVLSSKVYSFADAIPSILAFLGPTLIGCVVGLYMGRKSNDKRDIHTNIEYSWAGLPSGLSVKARCDHDWLCGKCRICGETDRFFTPNHGHDVICGKCTRCGIVPDHYIHRLTSHKIVDCKCTECGVEMHNFKLVSASGLRENFQCSGCGKKYTTVYKDESDYIGETTYLDKF
jgi:hypothetical protein